MNRGIYGAASGMVAAQTKLDVISHNLANTSTTGFKGEAVEFQESLEQFLSGEGGLGRALGSLGSGPVEAQRYVDFEVGHFTMTGNPLDLAISSPEGAFAVQTPEGVRFTRDGSFTLSDSGQLQTRSGFPVLDADQKPITLPTKGQVTVSSQGEISVEGKPIATVGVYQGEFTKAGPSLFFGQNMQPIKAPVQSMALEGSNVNAVEAMVDMIKMQRLFEMTQKMISSEDEATQKIIQSMNG